MVVRKLVSEYVASTDGMLELHFLPPYSAMPVFSAKCGAAFNVDTNPKGQVRMNGKLAQVINRPDGQISAKSDGASVDINPKGRGTARPG
ncbi:MAG: hypothetical protein NFW15_14225 [Candidatus Accumulibacter sp.]|nr:hypothetical protein [Accumulibacter sp.]MCM8613007.1 hypothetical protein [Accumulibacter sp.]MCM8637070.1 hypothetical protein [Accumulibacter sp.]MCM8640651.1 hypothetical protein [Accumulibacter sp.]